ncbi:aagr-4, partial [Pristionchus pacificus]
LQTMKRCLGALALICFVQLACAVDRGKFKSCTHSGFCKRHRSQKEPTGYEIVPDSISLNDTAVNAVLRSKEAGNKLKLNVVALEDSTLRINIDDDNDSPIKKRFVPVDVFAEGQPKQQKIKKHEQDENSVTLMTKDGHKIVIFMIPFRIDIYSKNRIVASLNSKELLKFEHYRRGRKPKKDGEGFWEEDFGESRDLKPWGSSSVGIDIALIGFKHAFGIPEHADGFSLRNTGDYEPYRLYNLDVFEYETSSPMALYGSVPFIQTVAKDRSIGFLWLNPSETWVDVEMTTADKGFHGSLISSEDKPSSQIPQVNTRFFSESGTIDLFFFLGQRPHDIARQHTTLTGVYPLPPVFSLGYHQCRWNYKNEKDLKKVNDKFDEHEIPLDVLWLDIEHTDEKKYFTWDKQAFPDPKGIIEYISSKGRKLVNIVDPHIKKDKKYDVYVEAQRNKYFVKDSDNKADYVGNCWPGDSKYIDFVNPKAREWWASLFALDTYKDTTNDVHIWNDMNEPSVFSGPEVTMHKDAVHTGGFEHREVHNMYGFYQHSATFDGLKKRSEGKLRPFVLTRSFFSGSQRSAAVWTGDNTADWLHLKVASPMLLSLSISGIPHVGADVGGFFKNPDQELLARWYQAGAFQPFFRGHSHMETKRREPYLFEKNTTDVIRDAIRTRYSFLPYWYTLFYEHTKTGLSPMRPLWMEFPEDETCHDEDREWLVGANLLVRPITEPGVKQVSLYLPGRREIWYEWNTHKARPAPGAVQQPADPFTIPIYQRGGSIIPVRDNIKGGSSEHYKEEPLTLYVAINSKGDFANGTIFIDDGESYEYENGKFAYWAITFKKEHDYLHTITNKIIDSKGKLDSPIIFNKIVIRGAKFYPRTAHIYLDDFTPDPLEFEYDRDNHLVTINAPEGLGFLTSDFRIDFHS